MMQTFSELDWNFDGVPDGELVACCYWEYARESAFIRDTLLEMRTDLLGSVKPDRLLEKSERPAWCDKLSRIKSIGYRADVFVRGSGFEPGTIWQSIDPRKPNFRHPDAPPLLPGSFPARWQSLSSVERGQRSRIGSGRSAFPLVPLERGDWREAGDIARWAEASLHALQAAFEKSRRENPKASEVKAIAQDRLRPYRDIQPSLYGAGGSEVTVLTINWAQFTNEQIIGHFRKWVKANRPKQARNPDTRGHKPGDWRAKLTRLAVMRLLSQFSAFQIVRQDSFPAIWETNQFSGRKWGDFTKWRDARREAGKIFHTLFPFLPKDEKPSSWGR